MGRILSSFQTRWRRAVERDGHAHLLGGSSVLIQHQNDVFDALRSRYIDDIEFNLLFSAYANSRAMIMVTGVLAICVSCLLFPISPILSSGWLVIALLVCAARRMKWQAFFDAVCAEVEGKSSLNLDLPEARRQFVQKWRSAYGIGLVLSGALWCVMLIPTINASEGTKFFTCFVIAGLAGGATGICAALKKEGSLYIASLLAPSSLILFLLGSGTDQIITCLALLSWTTFQFGLSSNHKIHRQSLELQAKNTRLVGELRDLNLSLENKVAQRTSELETAAMRDPLTDLPNRRGFRQAMDQALSKSERFTVGIIDLDGFKPINDAFGHSTGDQLLIEVGQRIRRHVGNIAQVARLGGDEFGFILHDMTDPAEVRRFGKILAESLTQPYELTAVVAEIGASVGLSRFPEDGDSTEILTRRADHALYFAKQFHKGEAVLFEPDHEGEICQLAQIEQALRRSDLDKEMSVHFQPIFDLDNGYTRTFEALARWNSAELGPVQPSLFIRAAERSGFIVELTRQLIRRTLRHALDWPKHMRVSINLSARDIASMDRVDTIISIVEESMVDPARIDFEVTETALVCDFGQARAALIRLSELGAKIALDDFGTGQSSLSHLQLLPLHKLKIDSSFISNMEADPKSQDIVEAMLLLCRSMKVDCILEGIETSVQLDMVRNLGGRLIQGYHIAHPMDADAVTDYIQAEQRAAITDARISGSPEKLDDLKYAQAQHNL